jgi:regulator of protease activity HflC (stomatin/prohibitin superfamily)
MATVHKADFSKIKEVVAAWSNIQQLMRSGEEGTLVPVVIPKDQRGYGWLMLAGFALYLLGMAVFSGTMFIAIPVGAFALLLLALAMVWWFVGAIIEIEQGTTGIISSFGRITGTLPPGRHYIWWPWQKIEAIVDTSTEIPYTAPVLASPTRENVPLKSIEFFLKFKIVDPVAFIRNIGASNFNIVLSSAVQDAIRQRSRQVMTEKAYDLRGSDVGDMQGYINRQMETYGVRIIGANIPDVQLPDQYQDHLATREKVAKELSAYEREWELVRKQRSDALLMEIERSKKERDARLIEVRAARNKAREDVAKMLQQRETEAQKIRWEIEARGRAALKSAENEARALGHLANAYKDNRAVLQYELAVRRLAVAQHLVEHAPRPMLIRTESGDQSALSTLVMAQLLPQLAGNLGDKPLLNGGNGKGGSSKSTGQSQDHLRRMLSGEE